MRAGEFGFVCVLFLILIAALFYHPIQAGSSKVEDNGIFYDGLDNTQHRFFEFNWTLQGNHTIKCLGIKNYGGYGNVDSITCDWSGDR